MILLCENDLVTKAIEHFGLTTNAKEAGYILPNGKMLDFSGKNEGGTEGERARDHREISFIFDGPVDAMDEFMRQTGAVRFGLPDGGGMFLDFRGRPTASQISVIKSAFKDHDVDFVEIDSPGGHQEVDPATWPLTMEKLRGLSLVAGQIKAVRAIVFDFDGTITSGAGYSEELPPPRPEMVERVRRAKALGLRVIIASARWSLHELNTQEEADAWLVKCRAYLEEHDIPFDELRQKPLGEVYVDDRACESDDFQRLDQFIDEAAASEAGQPNKLYLMTVLPDTSSDDVSERIRRFGQLVVPAASVWFNDGTGSTFQGGYEEEPHITMAYGIPASEALARLRAFLSDNIPGPVVCRLGKVSKFYPVSEAFDVVKIDIDCPALHELNKKLVETFKIPANPAFPIYIPHVTLAYVRKGECDNLIDNDTFEGLEVPLERFVARLCDSPKTVLEFSPGIRASFIDYPMPTLPPELWRMRPSDDGGDTYQIMEEPKAEIMDAAYQILDENFEGRDAWLTTVIVGSSLASQFYNEDTDLDVKFVIDMPVFKEHNKAYAEMSDDEAAEAVFELCKGYEGRFQAAGHPLEFFALQKKNVESGQVNEHYDSLYDLSNDTWIKEPVIVDAKTWSRDRAVGPGAKIASEWARKWDERFGKIRRDVQEIQMLNDYLPHAPDGSQHQEKMDRFLAEMSKEIKSLIKEKSEVMETRAESYQDEKRGYKGLVNSTPEIVQLKMLAHWGYFSAIKKLKAILKERERLTAEDAPEIAAVFNVEAPIVMDPEEPATSAPLDEIKASSDVVKFWITPMGQFHKFDPTDEHDPVLEELDPSFSYGQSGAEFQSGSDALEAAIQSGWVRGGIEGRGLYLQLEGPEDAAGEALERIPVEFTFVDSLSIQYGAPAVIFVEIPVLKGEDALDAWKHRKDPRHRVKSATNTVGGPSIEAHVRKRGDKWVVTNKAGDKTLGTHDTEDQAKKQLAAIEISKHMHGSIQANASYFELLRLMEGGQMTPQVFEHKVLELSAGQTDPISMAIHEGYDHAKIVGLIRKYRDNPSGHNMDVSAVLLTDLLAENKFDRLYKEANKVAQNDAKYSGALENPALAQEEGQFQQAVKQARTEDELIQVWQRYQPSVDWKTLVQIGGEQQEEVAKV